MFFWHGRYYNSYFCLKGAIAPCDAWLHCDWSHWGLWMGVWWRGGGALETGLKRHFYQILFSAFFKISSWNKDKWNVNQIKYQIWLLFLKILFFRLHDYSRQSVFAHQGCIYLIKNVVKILLQFEILVKLLCSILKCYLFLWWQSNHYSILQCHVILQKS